MKVRAPQMPRGAKVAAIEDYLKAHPNARNKEIIEALKGKVGIVNASSISAAKEKLGMATDGRATASGRRKRSIEVTCSGADLIRAKKFIEECGSVDNAKSLLQQYEAFFASV